MAYMVQAHFPGGTQEQYEATNAVVHPSMSSLPAGQSFHAAGAAAGGWSVVTVWESQETFERFRDSILMPNLQKGIAGGFAAPPQITAFAIQRLQSQ